MVAGLFLLRRRNCRVCRFGHEVFSNLSKLNFIIIAIIIYGKVNAT